MRVIIQPDDKAIAELVAESICNLINEKPDAVLGLATGSSPLGIYRELIRSYREGIVSFKHAWGFQLDEYSGLPADHPQRYRNVIAETIETTVIGPFNSSVALMRLAGEEGLGHDGLAGLAVLSGADEDGDQTATV